MPTLHIKNLHCIKTEDNIGADDAYIKVNAAQVWGPTRINDDQWRDVNFVMQFADSAIIELFDKDDIDSDDFLGSWTVNSGQRGEVRASFNVDDCNYDMFLEVRD